MPDAVRLPVEVRPAVDPRAGEVVVFLAGARVAAFLVVVFFAAVDVAGRPVAAFRAGAFRAVVFSATDFFAVVFLAGAFLAGAFLAVVFFAADFLAAVDVAGRPVAAFRAGAFRAVAFFAADLLAAVLRAVVFFAVAFVGDFLAVLDVLDGALDAAADVLDAALLLPVAFTVVLFPVALVAALVRVAAGGCAAGGSRSATAGFSVRVSFAAAGSAGVGTFAGMSASLTGMCVWSLNGHAGHTSIRHAGPLLTTERKTPTAAAHSHSPCGAARKSVAPMTWSGRRSPRDAARPRVGPPLYGPPEAFGEVNERA